MPLLEKFTEANPDKGTETAAMPVGASQGGRFTEANPDKGTETNILELR